jgi:hypothetical protein
MKFIILFSLVFLQIISLTVKADFAPTYGPEINLTKKEWRRIKGVKKDPLTAKDDEKKIASELQETADKLLEEIINSCPECEVLNRNYFQKAPVFKFVYALISVPKSDLLIYLTADNRVIEVSMTPLTNQKVNEYQDTIQKLIFDPAKKLGLTKKIGAGHLHIGMRSTFKNDLLLFRNFIVDTTIYSKVFYSLFLGNETNCPTLDILKSKNLENIDFEMIFKQIISDFDRTTDWTRAHDTKYVWQKSRELIAAINSEIYSKTTRDFKFQFINYLHLNNPENLDAFDEDAETLEIRGAPELGSALEYTLLTNLINSRLNYLRKMQRLILFEGILKPLNIEGVFDEYRNYAESAEVNWEKASPLIDKKYYKPNANQEVLDILENTNYDNSKNSLPINCEDLSL